MSAEPSEGGFRAVLFDYGGVLTTNLSLRFAEFFTGTGVDPERLRDLMAEAYADRDGDGTGGDRWYRSGLIADVETGRLPAPAFDAILAGSLSEGLATPLPSTGLSERIFGGLEPDPAMRDLLVALRDHGILIAMVSNTWGSPPELDGLRGRFDAVVLSNEDGCRKPEPRIYLLAATRLGVEPKECVFVDDIPLNVEGARAVGMAGVLHRDASITIPRLEKLLGVRLGRP